MKEQITYPVVNLRYAVEIDIMSRLSWAAWCDVEGATIAKVGHKCRGLETTTGDHPNFPPAGIDPSISPDHNFKDSKSPPGYCYPNVPWPSCSPRYPQAEGREVHC